MKLQGSVLSTTIDRLLGWARANSLWYYSTGFGCCADEVLNTYGCRYDLERFGCIPRLDPRHADLLMICGHVSGKARTYLQEVYEQMSDPKYVMAIGACACSGGVFSNYTYKANGVPVDVYVPGCPPRPESIMNGIIALQEKARNRARFSSAPVHRNPNGSSFTQRSTIGPYSGSLSGPLQLKVILDGEKVQRCTVNRGFNHRGLEKTFESHSWAEAFALADRLDPEGSIFGEWVLATALESLCGWVVPPRARKIRLVLCELTRISVHLLTLIRMAQSIGSETVAHFLLRDREKILDLFELLTGSRFNHHFLTWGGVRTDVTEGFVERVTEVCDLIHFRMKEYNELFTHHFVFKGRSIATGILHSEVGKKWGVTGPNARASGFGDDLRKTMPQLGYQEYQFEVPFGSSPKGDVHDRLLMRLLEMDQSILLLRQWADEIPEGEIKTELDPEETRIFRPPRGEASSWVESPRGWLGCYVQSDGGDRPKRVRFMVPSIPQLAAFEESVNGSFVEDLPLIFASLGMSLAEMDC